MTTTPRSAPPLDSRRGRLRALAGVLALTFLSLAATACDSSSGPVDDIFLLEGDLAYQGRESHNLLAMDDGIARIEVLDLQPKILDVTIPRILFIGLGLGRPNIDGECITSFTASAQRGSIFSIGLDEGIEYCVLLFDGGSLPEDAVIAYTVSVSPD